MKKNILFVCCCFAVNFSFSQTATEFYKQGISFYKAGDYKKSAIQYSQGIKQEGIAASIGHIYSCACFWSLAGFPDSAFYYLNIATASDRLTTNDVREIEDDSDFDLVKTDKRWRPTIDSMYKKAFVGIKKLSEDVRAGIRINPSIDKYDIAVAWGVAGNIDSAILYLSSIVNTDYNRFIDYDVLVKESAFKSLRTDSRWQLLVDEVRKHSRPMNCTHSSNPSPTLMKLTIDPKSRFLKSDGKGSYLDNVDKVSSKQNFAYNLLVSGIPAMLLSGSWNDLSPRYLVLDLNSPVENSGAVKHGIIKDHLAELHTFSKIDTSAKQAVIYNFNDIAIGTSVQSPRTEIMVHINGKLHILQFGFLSLGDCGESYANGGKINGEGTTSVKITHHSETSYLIEAPKGSIGRLWNVDNRSLPVDKGLFKAGFILHLENQ